VATLPQHSPIPAGRLLKVIELLVVDWKFAVYVVTGALQVKGDCAIEENDKKIKNNFK